MHDCHSENEINNVYDDIFYGIDIKKGTCQSPFL